MINPIRNILTLLLVPLFIFAQDSKKRVTIEQLFNVKTVQVEKRSTAQKQVNYGYIVAQESHRVDVPAWFGGYVEELYADKLYQKVTKDQPLATVYSPEVYQAKLDYLNSLSYHSRESAQGMIRSAREKLTLLNVSQKEIERIEKERKADRLTTIYAPISGWIFEKNINQGSSFKAQEKLFEIVNLKEVWVEAKLYQNELNKLDTLHTFTVKIQGINQIFYAKNPMLYPMLNPKEATATLRLTIDNKEELLKPGMYAKVYSSSDTSSNLVIPRTATIRKNGTWYAFLATEFKGEYEPVVIEVEPLDTMHYRVIKGLKEHDSIVNNALFMMDSDAQINGVY